MRPAALALSFAVPIALAMQVSTARAASQATIFENLFLSGAGEVEPSARAYAMGFSGGAITWGPDLDVRANPALLGYASGIRYEQGTRSLGGDVWVRTRETTLGGEGVGLYLAGQPFAGMDGIRWDVSLSGSTAYGPLPAYQMHDHVRAWGVGVSSATLAGALARRAGGEAPGFTRHVDLALGYLERVEQFRDNAGLDESMVAHDMGLLLRGRGLLWRDGEDGVRVAAEGAYGLSGWNTGGAPTASHHRQAAAARVAMDAPAAWRAALPAWAAPALQPLVSLGGAYDHDHASYPGYGSLSNASGAELGLTRLLALRIGEQEPGAPRTWGWALTLPIGRFAEAEYQHANFHEIDYSVDAWSLTLHPLAFLR